MSKYELIKKYPGSPKLGTIVTKSPVGWYTASDWGTEEGGVENYPEFWKKVEEIPEYVKLISGWSVDDEFVGKIFSTKLDFQEQFEEFKGINKTWDWESIFSDHFFKYHGKYFEPSTKEEFDKQQLVEEAKRRGFFEKPSKLIYPWQAVGIIRTPTLYNDCTPTYNSNINELYIGGVKVYYKGQWAEITKPIFTTEDGVDIYEGDKYYITNTSTYVSNIANKESGNLDYCKYFSTKEAAQKWIDENKPQYSKKQVINILRGFDKEINEFTCEDGELEYSKYIEKYKDNENLL